MQIVHYLVVFADFLASVVKEFALCIQFYLFQLETLEEVSDLDDQLLARHFRLSLLLAEQDEVFFEGVLLLPRLNKIGLSLPPTLLD